MKILNTEQILYYQKKTMDGAESRLLIVSPYIKLDDDYLKKLINADNDGVKIIIVCGKSALSKLEIDKLRLITNLELFFCHNLHAKCILNEKFAVVSSMNLYESSQGNFELGCLLSSMIDFNPFCDLEQYCFDIIKSSEKYRMDICRCKERVILFD